jgi:hypothetical protein
LRRIDVALVRGLPAALMIDRSSEERLLNCDEVFFRAAIDHQCAGRSPARTDATKESAQILLIREISVCF